MLFSITGKPYCFVKRSWMKPAFAQLSYVSYDYNPASKPWSDCGQAVHCAVSSEISPVMMDMASLCPEASMAVI